MSRTLDALRRRTQDPRLKAISVDVFDTLLLRTTMPEPQKFLRIARLQAAQILRRPGDHNLACALLMARLSAARIRYRTRPLCREAREATFAEILDLMYRHLLLLRIPGLPGVEEFVSLSRTIELTVEQADLSLRLDLHRLLREAEAVGRRIIAVSDMYLSANDIAFLIRAKGGGALARIYVSSEYGYGKACGALFDELLQQEALAPSEVLHIGDNRWSDYSVPQSKGIAAVWLPRGAIWRIARGLRARALARRLGGSL